MEKPITNSLTCIPTKFIDAYIIIYLRGGGGGGGGGGRRVYFILLFSFFQAHLLDLQAWFFSTFLMYRREIRGCTASIEWYSFSRTTSYFLRKCQKSPSLQISVIKPRNDLLKVSEEKLKLLKKSYSSFFLN